MNLLSPDKRLKLGFSDDKYSVSVDGKRVIWESALGFLYMSGGSRGIMEQDNDMREKSEELMAGQYKEEAYNELSASLSDGTEVTFRAFDNAIIFRYILKGDVREEMTEYNLKEAEIICSDKYEGEYESAELCNIKKDRIVCPVLLKSADVWLSITEAALESSEFAGMYLKKTEKGLKSSLASEVREADKSPWRVIVFGRSARELVDKVYPIIMSLNEPCVIDASWVRAGKAVWPWWNGYIYSRRSGEPNTELYEEYADFASKHGFEYLLIDAGWYCTEKEAWEKPKEQDLLVQRYVNVEEVVKYAEKKGVRTILWVHGDSLRDQMDVLSDYEHWGVAGIKIDGTAREDQEWIRFVKRCVKKAAERHLIVDLHGTYKPTGFERTYPNLLTYEAVLGLEWSKWIAKPTAEHNLFLPFTRMLCGPMDYTPGAFDLDGTETCPKMVQTTRAQQLAMYVVYRSPLQMIPDYPWAYEDAEEFELVKEVPTIWDETIVLEGEPGEWIAIARRRDKRWFVGAMTARKRKIELKLDFIEPEREYEAEMYEDGEDRDEVRRSVRFVRYGDVIELILADSGGAAIEIS